MKFFFLFLLIHTVYAMTDPELFSSSLIDLEQLIDKTKSESVYKSKQHILTDNALAALSDKKNIIDNSFSIPDYFHSSVYFWFSIYTQYSSKQVLIHDKDNLAIIYRVLDFNELHQSDLNIFTKYKIQNLLAQENIQSIKKSLKNLSIGIEDDGASDILNILSNNKISYPKNKKKKRDFFKSLATNLRTQTGQKNMIYMGIINSEIYSDYLFRIMDDFKIPNELLAIAFLESSFNYKAVSRVGASGIWQFMPYIANLFLPKITKQVDYRSNPILASIAAFHLLRQNKRILKRWDLAVPAYNSGTKHLIRAKRKFTHIKKVDLAYILENYNHPHLGFASQNFYSEFLALVHALKYKNTFFNLNGKLEAKKFNNDKLKIYASLCKFKTLALNKKFNNNILDLNPQFDSKRQIYNAGSLIVSDKDLPRKYFYPIKESHLSKKLPRNWAKSIKAKSCKFL